MISERERLPKTLSYPVKASTVQEALTNAGVGIEVHLKFLRSRIFLDAHFWPAGSNVSHERLYVRVGAVSALEAQAARTFMSEQAMPAWWSGFETSRRYRLSRRDVRPSSIFDRNGTGRELEREVAAEPRIRFAQNDVRSTAASFS